MYNKKLQKYVKEYKFRFNYDNKNIILDVISQIQNFIEFTFELEETDIKLRPKLILAEEAEDTDSNKTHGYKEPQLFISLQKRAPVSGDLKNSLHTFADSNVISGYPRYNYKSHQNKDGQLMLETLMTFDNHFKLELITKTVNEQLQIVNIIERALNIYSGLIQPQFIIVCGILSVESSDKKTNNKTLKTTINFHVRTKEVVEIDKNYIMVGYRIYSGQYQTGTGEVVDEQWNDYAPMDTDYDFYPPEHK